MGESKLYEQERQAEQDGKTQPGKTPGAAVPGIWLYAHNEKAYRAAAAMLKQQGKAAVIHPTGTGKSFLGFRLAKEHPEKRVVWLSPSAYIFRTQLENLEAGAPGSTPSNIRFCTYARLLLMEEEELLGLSPDYIILDEFHRCGAAEWEKSLKRFLGLFPEAKVLGLSATSVRYLDNQRDMAEELFDGNIASEMSLGEAVALGILQAPLYVSCVYGWEKELEGCQRRVEAIRNQGVRKESQRRLDALRRALEQADGLDRVFQKYMKKDGKYLLFCAGKAHMDEMVSQAGAWFGGLDQNPRIYQVYSEDQAAGEAFEAFKRDTSSHLKLLFCIDMLNEGVHVEGVDGVVLLRPTVSPTIYKQQIGRALSVGRGKEAVIFDVVNNLDSLCSIRGLQEEVGLAVTYYREHGEGGRVVHERFRVREEVRDCRRLFEDLQKSLSAPWEINYQAARAYYEEHGNLEVPGRYRTGEGLSLGAWLTTQRRVRNGQVAGSLSEAQIARLDAIGMVWENRLEAAWEANYRAAKAYYEAHGNLDMKAGYETPEGRKLGAWVCRMRQERAGHIRSGLLTPERIARLDAIGMVWDKFSLLWEQNYQAAAAYYITHGDLKVPSHYKTEEGMALGKWVAGLRRQRAGKGPELAPEQIRRLDAIGMQWEGVWEGKWERAYGYAEAYHRLHGNLEMGSAYTTEEGYPLGEWVQRQRQRYQERRLPEGQKKRLEALGMRWEREESWQMRYGQAKRYAKAHGNLDVPPDYRTEEGVWLGKWVYEQRKARQGKGPSSLTGEQIRLLDAIGMDWRSPAERAWETKYEAAKAYYEAHGNLEMPKEYKAEDGKGVRRWVQEQRKKQREGRLSREQEERLRDIGMDLRGRQERRKVV